MFPAVEVPGPVYAGGVCFVSREVVGYAGGLGFVGTLLWMDLVYLVIVVVIAAVCRVVEDLLGLNHSIFGF